MHSGTPHGTTSLRKASAIDQALHCESGWPGGSPPTEPDRKAIVALNLEIHET
jgi:hypothetical protein